MFFGGVLVYTGLSSINTLLADSEALSRRGNRAIVLGMENTDIQAIERNNGIQDFWARIDAELTGLADFLNNKNDTRHAAQVRGLRASLAMLRLNLVKFMTALTPDVRKTAEAEVDKYNAEVHATLAEVVKTVPAADGGDRVRTVIDHFDEVGIDALAEARRPAAVWRVRPAPRPAATLRCPGNRSG